MVNNLINIGMTSSRSRNSDGIRDLIRKSSKAVCGAFEREITVLAEQVSPTKERLRRAGFMIVGTSEPGTRTRKIWFIRQGAAGL